MSTFTTIKANIKDNLADANVTYYGQTDIDTATQNAYAEILALSKCYIKKVTLLFPDNNLVYLDFTDINTNSSLYVSDFMMPLAVFSNLTNLWLLDDKTIKDFDQDRIDFELWTGSSVWWAPTNDYRRLAFIPHMGGGIVAAACVVPTSLGWPWIYTGGLNGTDYAALIVDMFVAGTITGGQAIVLTNLYNGTLISGPVNMPADAIVVQAGFTAIVNYSWKYTGQKNAADFTTLLNATLAAGTISAGAALRVQLLYNGTFTGAAVTLPHYAAMVTLGFTYQESNSFDLYYAAQAPTVVAGDTPYVPTDFQDLIELYATYSLLADAQEYTKAQAYWDEFFGAESGEQNFDAGIYALMSRTKNLAMSDLLMLA